MYLFISLNYLVSGRVLMLTVLWWTQGYWILLFNLDIKHNTADHSQSDDVFHIFGMYSKILDSDDESHLLLPSDK